MKFDMMVYSFILVFIGVISLVGVIIVCLKYNTFIKLNSGEYELIKLDKKYAIRFDSFAENKNYILRQVDRNLPEILNNQYNVQPNKLFNLFKESANAKNKQSKTTQ